MSALDSASLHVSPMLDWLGRCVGHHPAAWIALGNVETKLLAGELDNIKIDAPIYVSGLARSGSTILLEILAAQSAVATHRYADFPFLFTPYWWNCVRKCNPMRGTKLRERAHGDGMMVGPESPEAMEEMLWMAFFPECHNSAQNQAMSSISSYPPFEEFYRRHIQKLLLARRKTRYASKGNYNLTRLPYLRTLFKDARFVIPVREPAAHIESLMRQHERFCAAGKRSPRVVTHMNLVGHFEFGLGRKPIHVGDAIRLQEIEEAWKSGAEVRGWALYWDMLYGHVQRLLENDPLLKESSLVVRYETLCDAPSDTIRRLLAHAGLPEDRALTEKQAAGIHPPDYYTSGLSGQERALIQAITSKTASFYGY